MNGSGPHESLKGEKDARQNGHEEADPGEDGNDQEVIVIQDTGFTVKICAPGIEPFSLQVAPVAGWGGQWRRRKRRRRRKEAFEPGCTQCCPFSQLGRDGDRGLHPERPLLAPTAWTVPSGCSQLPDSSILGRG